MKKTLFACVLSMMLVNTAWSQWNGWEVKCNQDSMTDDKSCALTTFYKNVGISLAVINRQIIMGVIVTDIIIDSNSTHQFRVDKYRAWNSQSSDTETAIFYGNNHKAGKWSRLVQELKSGENVHVRLYLWPYGVTEKTFTLFGFNEAYEQLRRHVKKFIGINIDKMK
jgi:hypothetical protein